MFSMKVKNRAFFLISKSWLLLLFGFVMGYILGGAFQKTYEVKMYGFEIVLAMLMVGCIWAGLNVGFYFAQHSK